MMRIILVFTLLTVAVIKGIAGEIRPGADQPENYLPALQEKRVGLVVNQSSLVGQKHLVDFLLENQVQVMTIFSPEHGFRGDADAGKSIDDQVDEKTGIPIVSLYGTSKKPAPEHLKSLDIVVYDIQDVGVRFYTYLSTLHYVMEACAAEDLPLLLLDRPNPNGDYVDGPVLKPEFKSFVGMHPIPVVHGCTLGEMAGMINGEGWLRDEVVCDLIVVPVANYTHKSRYSLPVKPSPNLPNDLAIRLYPSLCFFEATTMSIGRGTYFPFQVIGFPDKSFGNFQFTPKSIPGMAEKPLHQDKLCFGEDLRSSDPKHRFTLEYLVRFYHRFPKESEFISSERWLNLLAGTDQLLNDLRSGKCLPEIELSWASELKSYMALRKKYLLYPDFECHP